MLVRQILCFSFVLFLSQFGRAQDLSTPSPARGSGEMTLVFVGDSLTQGYGVKKNESFPELVSEQLKKNGRKVKVINGGVSGSLSSSAEQRVRWYLKIHPDVIFICLGANDSFKGTPPSAIKQNLSKAIALAQAAQVRVVLAGMRPFRNMGEKYVQEFEGVFRDLAKMKNLTYMPFLLDGVALKPELNQADGKHPNAQGHILISQNVLKVLEPVLDSIKK